MPKILLVEDDPNFRTVLALALELEGFTVRQAGCGQSALDLMDREVPDIIVSDLEMGGIDGRALCKRTRAESKYKSIPFVILSAFVGRTEGGLLDDLPADRFLSKQIPVSELTRSILDLLERRSRPE
jgi:CheY-like chemotaxis protein